MDTSYIIPPVNRSLIKEELKRKNFLRKTNFGNKEIYVTTARQSPNVMREIGRLRELSYVLEGGGTGKEVDIDRFDTLPEPYCFKQLLVWDPEEEEIVGGYRFIHGSNMRITVDGHYDTPSAEFYDYSEMFTHNILPFTLELGRAFVQPAYQPSNNLRKGMYSLDNLWDGLAAIAVEIPETHYYFGKITTYTTLPVEARDMICYFYRKHFPDRDGLVWPRDPVPIQTDLNRLDTLFTGRNYKEDFQILQRNVREMGHHVPALISAYMNLSTSMRYFGTIFDADFGNTYELGILVKVRDIHPEKHSRYFGTYEKRNRLFDRINLFRINPKRLPWWKTVNEEEMAELNRLRDMKRRNKRFTPKRKSKTDKPEEE